MKRKTIFGRQLCKLSSTSVWSNFYIIRHFGLKIGGKTCIKINIFGFFFFTQQARFGKCFKIKVEFSHFRNSEGACNKFHFFRIFYPTIYVYDLYYSCFFFDIIIIVPDYGFLLQNTCVCYCITSCSFSKFLGGMFSREF